MTVQTYQTSVRFDFDALCAGLERGWLQPAIPLGVYDHTPPATRDEVHVILGLQGERSVRTFDYDRRAPQWYALHGLIIETLAVRYRRDDDGFIRFTTAGGRRGITDARLAEFHSTFLNIPRDSVHGMVFDLSKLRDLCFTRFLERLYEIRFSEPSSEDYRSIDHASFESRGYIDPTAERLRAIRDDPTVKVEAFESDIPVTTDDLSGPAEVGFAIRGQRGSVRLSFPKFNFKAQFKTAEEQTRAVYRLVDEAVRSILDRDYYAEKRLSIAALGRRPTTPLFPDYHDFAPFVEVLKDMDIRRAYFAKLDVSEPEMSWVPQLQALNGLMEAAAVDAHVTTLLSDLVRRDPAATARILAVSREAAHLSRVGGAASNVLCTAFHSLPADVRPRVEAELMAWLVDHDGDGWDVDVTSDTLTARTLRWNLSDLNINELPVVLWKLITVFHTRLCTASDVVPLLAKFKWCTAAATALSPRHPRAHAALRLLSSGRALRTLGEINGVLKQPVASLRDADDELIRQLALPTWPTLEATRIGGNVVLTNSGLGTAHALRVDPSGGAGAPRAPLDLLPGAAVEVPAGPASDTIDVIFEKYGEPRHGSVSIALGAPSGRDATIRVTTTISRRRTALQRELRSKIDRDGKVVGASPAVFQIFEDIEFANTMEGEPAVLILGETGVGKSFIARLIHDAGPRRTKSFKDVTAAAVGGDHNIQRGEWIGYGRKSGIAGVPEDGRAGHVVASDGGTLFIDEFALLSPEMQGVFLSVIERHAVQQVGGDTVKPNVRCVLATNADVDALASEGKVKPDLLARVPVRITIPPLRERRGDVLLLARSFATPGKPFTERALLALARHSWPQNIRELKAKVQAATARATVQKLDTIDSPVLELPARLLAEVAALGDEDVRRELWTLADQAARDEGFEPNKGLFRRVAEIVGVSESTVSRTYAALGLEQPRG
ncbi:MAG: sigma 54-interacting transcriptional regulator [Planctomycetes bacterium]|nr:sigma 54-interacting transcriptional regulator [Planctomycetota bacterium]